MALSRNILTPFRVGIVVILGVASFFVLLSFLAKQKYSDTETYRVYATFADASGLGPKSRVQIAGIEVGIVEKIELTPDARARAVLRIKNDVPLRENARITKRSASLLGDYLLDVYPGSPDKPLLPEGAEVGRVIAQAGVEDVFAALGDVTRDIQQVTTSLKDLLASEQGVGSIKEIIRSMNEVAQGLNRTIDSAGGRLDNILADVETLTGDVRGLASGQQRTVEEILYNVRSFTDQANKVIVSINQIVGTGEDELKGSVADVRVTLQKLQQTLDGAGKALESMQGTIDDSRNVIARVDRGEGTLGKLVRDDGIAMKIDKALADVNGLIKPISDLQTHVQIREEVHLASGAGGLTKPSGKASVQVKLVPRPDKHYGLELVSEPRGRTTREVTVTNGTPTTVDTTTNDVKISAYLGKRYGPAVLRVGLIEDTGGFGGDLLLGQDRFRLSFDAFDFSNPVTELPRLRASAQYTMFDHLYVGAGVDDFLNPTLVSGSNKVAGGLDVFVTGGLQFNDEDLKSLLTVVGAPSVK